jgi:hypothetical protein
MLVPLLGLSSAKVLIIYLIIPKNPPVTPNTITPIADMASGDIIIPFQIWFCGEYFLQTAKFVKR